MKKLLSVIALLILVLSMGMQLVKASTQPDASQESAAIEDSKQSKLTDEQKQQATEDSEQSKLSNEQELQGNEAGKDSASLNKQPQAKLADDEKAEPQKNEGKTTKASSGNSRMALDDYEWTEVTQNPKGEIAQPDGSTIVYGFGGKSRENTDVKSIPFGKPNVYVQTKDGKFIQHMYNGDTTQSSTTGLMFIENTSTPSDIMDSGKNLKVMTATDENGHTIIRASMISSVTQHDWEINAVLKASDDGKTIHHEYYLTNLGVDKEISFGKNVNTVFKRPLLALGDNKGISILDGAGNKFNYVTKTEDGPENWDVSVYNNTFLGNFSPKNWTGVGVEAKGLTAGSVIAEGIDAGVKLKWQPRMVKTNETTHIRYDVQFDAHKNEVDDMYDWTEFTKNQRGEVLQPNGNTLIYGFDGTSRENIDVTSVNFGRPNVYLKTAAGDNIQHLYNGSTDMYTSKGLLFLDGTKIVDDILGSNTTRPNPKLMTATDEFGHTVLRANMVSSATGKDWEIDEILKPSMDGQNIQHEYYITNLGEERALSIGRAVDTRLGTNDNVPIQAIGKNRGMFIESGPYRLYYRTNMKDGPDNWNGAKFNNDYFSNFSPADWTGAGVEAENLPQNAVIADNIDTGLKLKWQPKNVKLDQTVHYRYDVGITATGQPVPTVEKSVKNISSEDQNEAKLGDKLRYTINLSNSGDENWDSIELTDVLPEAVSDPENIELTHADGTTANLPVEDLYNETNRTLTLDDFVVESDNEISLSFDVKIVNNEKREIVNTARAEGLGPDDKKYAASGEARMKVKESSIPRVEKTVKNVNGSDDYLPGDTVEYSLKVGNDHKNTAISWDNISLKDIVPEDVTVDPTSFHKTYTKSDGTKEESDLAQDTVWQESTRQLLVKQDALKGTEDVVVTFKAKIKNSVANKLVQNTLEVISDEFDPITADVSFNVAGQLEFISAPKNISFGKLPIKSFKQTYKPESWDEALQVKDNRSLTISPRWSMLVKLEKPLTGAKSTETLSSLYYKADGQEQMITDEDGAQIYEHTTTDSNAVTISDLWDDDTGLRLDVPAGKAKKDVYSGTLVWTLQDVPGTE